MSLPVILRAEAVQDVEAARDHIDAARSGFGAIFVNRLDETLKRIESRPEVYGIAWRNVRSARLRRFPYSVYYRQREDCIEVLAVMHASRNASWWRDRV